MIQDLSGSWCIKGTGHDQSGFTGSFDAPCMIQTDLGSLILIQITPKEGTANNTQHVATRWPNVRNILRPIMLQHVALACRGRFPFDRKFRNEISGDAFHYAKDSGYFGRNSNGKDRFGFFRPEYSGSPLEVVHSFWLEYSDRNSPFHFGQAGSLP